jgi:hypothetical protein
MRILTFAEFKAQNIECKTCHVPENQRTLKHARCSLVCFSKAIHDYIKDHIEETNEQHP